MTPSGHDRPSGRENEEQTPALELVEVTHRFGHVTALNRVTLRVPTGEMIAVVGESGSGKTTLLRCFNRLLVPDEGAVRALGQDVRDVDPVALRRRTGYVPQDGGLMPHWSVMRNVALVPRLLGDRAANRQSLDSLRQVGLPPEQFADRRPSELSGGQRQRVAIARALASRPDVLLMDEPFGALDAITRSDLHETLRALRRDWPVTTVFVTHDLHEARHLADRIAVMHEGAVDQVGPADELIRVPATPYVRSLLSRVGLQ